LRIRLHAEAIRELEASVTWYEAQQTGLGEEFLGEFSRAIEVISQSPRAWPVWPEWRSRMTVHRFVLHRFPFLLAYIVRREHILILAVAHARRRPGYWRERIRR